MQKQFHQRSLLYLLTLIGYSSALCLVISLFLVYYTNEIFKYLKGAIYFRDNFLSTIYLAIPLTTLIVLYQFIIKRSDKLILQDDRLIYSTLFSKYTILYNNIELAEVKRGTLTKKGINENGSISFDGLGVSASYRFFMVKFRDKQCENKLNKFGNKIFNDNLLVVQMNEFVNGTNIPNEFHKISKINIINEQISKTDDVSRTDKKKISENEKNRIKKINLFVYIITGIIFAAYILEIILKKIK